MRHPASLAARAWLVTLIGFAACAEPDLSSEVAEYASHRDAEAGFACSCPEDLNFGSYEECVAALGEVDETEQACMADLLGAEGQNGKDYIDCVNTAWSAHRDCLMANPGCEPGWYDSCAADRSAAENTCTQVAQDTAIAFAFCDLN